MREHEYINLELNYEDVAEFMYQPGKCSRPYRVVALRKNIKSWFAMMMHLKSDWSAYLGMEFRRFFSAWRTIEKTRFG